MRPLFVVFVVNCLLFPLLSVSSERLLTIEDIVYRHFRPEYFNGSWASDTEIVYRSKNTGDIVALDVTSLEVKVLANSSLMSQYNATSFTLSADMKWIAIQFDKLWGFRHSFTAKYAIHELKTGFNYVLAGGSRVQLLEWSPVGHALVFVKDNDLYYQHKPGHLAADRITLTGVPGVVYNGIADWVYEEEVFAGTKAVWFSPEGTKLAFATFNDSAVREVDIIRYGKPGDLDRQYVEEIPIRYPKPGSVNPAVFLNVVDLRLKRSLKIVNLAAPIKEVSEDHILGVVKWVDDSHVASIWSPRIQNSAVTIVCDVSNGECEKVFEFKEPKGWVDWKVPMFKNTTTFLTVLPQPQDGDAGNYKQLVLVTPSGQSALTMGHREVMQTVAWDHNNSIAFFIATQEDNPGRIHLYSVGDDGTESPKCISCDICGTVSVMFSKGNSYMVLVCMGPDVPSYAIYNTNGAKIMDLGSNNRLKESQDDLLLSDKRDIDVPLEDNMTARVRLLIPPGVKNEDGEDKKYPLILKVYGGPDSQLIDDKYQAPGWEEYLATRLGAVVAFVDGRGTGRRGDKLKFSIYRKLGGPEIDDFISVAKYLQNNLHFIDKSRTGIWGWSYGGYATAMSLAKDTEDLFKCGISVAPVTSWIYYDSVYTERYMGLPTPDDNEAGYNASDVTRRIDNFRNKMFYLIHGTADDNVHYQQSMALARALETHDILFYQQSYPDEVHDLGGVKMHLYHSMEKFWSKCIKLESV